MTLAENKSPLSTVTFRSLSEALIVVCHQALRLLGITRAERDDELSLMRLGRGPNSAELTAHGAENAYTVTTHWGLAPSPRELTRPNGAAGHHRRSCIIECQHDGARAAATVQTAHASAEDVVAAAQRQDALVVNDQVLTSAVMADGEDEVRDDWVMKLRTLWKEQAP